LQAVHRHVLWPENEVETATTDASASSGTPEIRIGSGRVSSQVEQRVAVAPAKNSSVEPHARQGKLRVAADMETQHNTSTG
jgi:hypothetical protein